MMSQRFVRDPHYIAGRQASAVVYGTPLDQASLLAFVNDFRWLAILCFRCVLAALLLKRVRVHGPAPGP